MAAVSGAITCHATLTGTTADTVTLTEDTEEVMVVNRHATEVLWVKVNGTTAVAAEDENYAVPAGQILRLPGNFQNRPLSVVGNANPYSVQAV